MISKELVDMKMSTRNLSYLILRVSLDQWLIKVELVQVHLVEFRFNCLRRIKKM
jgi:hypothetical protein